MQYFRVDEDNPNYKSDGNMLLTKDGKTLIAGINGNVVIPDGVKTIGSTAFSGRAELTNITIPESVTNIGDYAFCYCSGLSGISIPINVTLIGGHAFEGCV